MILTPEERRKIEEFIKNDVRFKGMTLADAEQLAFAIMRKWAEQGRNFLLDFKSDVTMIGKMFTGGK